MSRLSTVGRFGKRVFSEFSEKNVTFMAAGLAYNAFISLAPMLVLLFLVLSVIGGDSKPASSPLRGTGCRGR